MRRVLVIGIGMGQASQLTFRAAEALGQADLFLLLEKGEAAAGLVALREGLLARFAKPGHRVVRAPSPRRLRPPLPAGEADADAGAARDATYRASVAAWHGERAALLAEWLARELPEDGTAAILVWGDPMLYDSTLRVLEGARAVLARRQVDGPADGQADWGAGGGSLPPEAPAGFTVEVVPGLSALQMLCAAHSIPLNGVGEPVLVTTGRRVAERTPDAPAFAVLLDDGSGLSALLARGWTGEVWWGACLGTPDEALLAGPLTEVGVAILNARAAIRARLGWVMDVWLARPL